MYVRKPSLVVGSYRRRSSARSRKRRRRMYHAGLKKWRAVVHPSWDRRQLRQEAGRGGPCISPTAFPTGREPHEPLLALSLRHTHAANLGAAVFPMGPRFLTRASHCPRLVRESRRRRAGERRSRWARRAVGIQERRRAGGCRLELRLRHVTQGTGVRNKPFRTAQLEAAIKQLLLAASGRHVGRHARKYSAHASSSLCYARSHARRCDKH